MAALVDAGPGNEPAFQPSAFAARILKPIPQSAGGKDHWLMRHVRDIPNLKHRPGQEKHGSQRDAHADMLGQAKPYAAPGR